jgi:ABC-2 type transport system ATP-binding protein
VVDCSRPCRARVITSTLLQWLRFACHWLPSDAPAALRIACAEKANTSRDDSTPHGSRTRNQMIKLRKLTKLFGPQVAVHGIDLDIPDGQLVGLLGPNGAGKSTTIKMLTGMLLPTSGTAEVGGFDVVQDPLSVKRIIGYVPETGAVFEALTGWEYLQLVAALYHIPENEATERIQRFGQFFDLTIDTLQEKQLSAYSKGMRQKVVITAALLHNPKIVFLDEPLNGLDANAALSLKTLITSLAHEGKTIVYCSHILDVVERICERVVIIHQGSIVADGTVSQLMEKTGEKSLEHVFNKLTATENLLARAEEFARVLTT